MADLSAKAVESRTSPGLNGADDLDARPEGEKQYEKTTPEFLADLEHEFWLSRDPVRLGLAACQHERDLQLSRRQRIRYSPSLAGGSGHRLDRPADHRRHERPHLDLARSPSSLLFGGRDPVQPGF